MPFLGNAVDLARHLFCWDTPYFFVWKSSESGRSPAARGEDETGLDGCTRSDVMCPREFRLHEPRRAVLCGAVTGVWLGQCTDWVRLKDFYVVEIFSANFSENCSEAVGQQREIQNSENLLVQLSTVMYWCRGLVTGPPTSIFAIFPHSFEFDVRRRSLGKV